MAEGTRLKDMNEHITTLETRVQKLTMDYQDKVGELATQIKEVSEVEQLHFEALQIEATKRHELMLKDNALRHDELLKLFSSHTAPHIATVTNPQPYPVPREAHCKEEVSGIHVGNRDIKGKGILPIPNREWQLGDDGRRSKWGSKPNNHPHIPYPKLEFPVFGGEDPKAWVENCENYFEVYQIPQD